MTLPMQYTILGKTGLRVSVAGLGCGGFSRLGLAYGKGERNAIEVIRKALDSGINLVDTAPAYETEAVVGRAIRGVDRNSIVLCTKALIGREGEWASAAAIEQSLGNSLRQLGSDYVDVFQLHSVPPSGYEHAKNVLLPALKRQKERGKIRHIGISEGMSDSGHLTLERAVQDEGWETILCGFNLMHQNARTKLLPLSRMRGIGTLAMYAVRGIFASRQRLREELEELHAAGKLGHFEGDMSDALGFLLRPGGVSSTTEAAYRFVRHEPGIDVVLFGTGNPGHVAANVRSLLEPPLPQSDLDRIKSLFGHLVGIGLDSPLGAATP